MRRVVFLPHFQEAFPEFLNCQTVESSKYIFGGLLYAFGSRDSLVGITTRYGLEGPGIESRCGEIFRTYPDRLRGPPSLLYNRYRVFPGDKGGRGVMLTTHPLSSAEVKKELSYTSTQPMGPPGPVAGFPLHFFFLCTFNGYCRVFP
jgi:hypothetical protein